MRLPGCLLRFSSALIVAGSLGFGLSAAELNEDFSESPAEPSSPDSEFMMTKWTSGDGLPANEIQDLEETPDGYLWLGTYQGLVRFDGVQFQSFFTTPTGLRYGTRIDPLELDGKGRLWFAPDEPGLMYRGRDGFQEVFTNGFDLTARIESLCSDGTNTLWWLDANGTLGRINVNEKSSIETLKERASPSSRWAQGFDGKLWLIGSRRLRVLEGGELKEVYTPGNATLTATPCRNGGMWIAREARLRLVTAEGALQNHGLFPWHGTSRVQCMVEDSRNRLWIGTVGQGVYCYEKGQFKQVVATASSVTCLYEDSAKNIWAGTRGSGLLRISERKFLLHGLSGGLRSEFIRSLAEDPSGRMWLLTTENGLGWVQHRQWHPLDPEHGWPGYDALCVCPLRDGSVLVSTVRRGIWRWSEGALHRPATDIAGPREQVSDLLEDHRGRIWMVTDNNGVFCLDGSSMTNYDISTGLPSNYIRCLAKNHSGEIFAGDWEGGISRFAGERWQIIRKPSGHADAIRAMVAAEGALWIGTSAGGLLRVKDGKSARVTVEQGLPDNSIRQVITDGRGSLWGGTAHRLFRISVDRLNAVMDGRERQLEPIIYGRGDGLPELSFSSWCDPRSFLSKNGEVWLATANGALHFQPAALPERKVPQILVDPPLLDGKMVSAAGLQQLRPGAQRLEFRFTAPCLTAPERVRFRYRLTGVDKDWVEAGTTRTAIYGSLPPGHHEFQVNASSPDGIWGTEHATLSLAVHPFFWQSDWFLAVVVAAIAGGGAWLIRRATVRRLRGRVEQLRRQHAMERERARIAQDIHDELGANLTSIGLLADMGARHKANPNAVSKDLEQISQTARESVAAMDAIVWAINPRNDSLDHFANYVTHFAKGFFAPTNIRTRFNLPANLPSYPLPAETRHELFLLVKESFNNIARHAQASEMQLQLACDENNLRLTICDNGKGLPKENGGRTGNGITNLRDRARRLGGELEIHSDEGTGVRLEFSIPLPKPALN